MCQPRALLQSQRRISFCLGATCGCCRRKTLHINSQFAPCHTSVQQTRPRVFLCSAASAGTWLAVKFYGFQTSKLFIGRGQGWDMIISIYIPHIRSISCQHTQTHMAVQMFMQIIHNALTLDHSVERVFTSGWKYETNPKLKISCHILTDYE